MSYRGNFNGNGNGGHKTWQDIVTEIRKFKEFGEIHVYTETELYKYLIKLMHEIKGVVPEVGSDNELEYRMSLVLYEALSNSLRHGKPPMRVSLLASKRRVSVVVEDRGEKFNPPQNVEARLGQMRSHGWGWVLILKLCDKVVYTPDNGTNRLYLVFNLPHR